MDDDNDWLDGFFTGWILFGDSPKGLGGIIFLLLVVVVLIVLHYNGYL